MSTSYYVDEQAAKRGKMDVQRKETETPTIDRMSENQDKGFFPSSLTIRRQLARFSHFHLGCGQIRVGPVSHPCSDQEGWLPQIPNQEWKQYREDEEKGEEEEEEEEEEEGVEWASRLLVMGG